MCFLFILSFPLVLGKVGPALFETGGFLKVNKRGFVGAPVFLTHLSNNIGGEIVLFVVVCEHGLDKRGFVLDGGREGHVRHVAIELFIAGGFGGVSLDELVVEGGGGAFADGSEQRLLMGLLLILGILRENGPAWVLALFLLYLLCELGQLQIGVDDLGGDKLLAIGIFSDFPVADHFFFNAES